MSDFQPCSGAPPRVLKFGGTSLGTAERLRQATRIVRTSTDACRPVVVASAAEGVTDALAEGVRAAASDPDAAEDWTRRVVDHYRSIGDAVLADASFARRYRCVLDARASVLRRALRAQAGPGAAAARDAALASGERMMVPLLALALRASGCPAHPVDAASLIATDGRHGEARVDRERTHRQIQAWADARVHGVPVVTGFVGAGPDGRTTTLGRGGSDLSAALLALGLSADRLERWTDVDGLYTRDPAVHDDARRLERLTFEQARTWIKRGRLGMHARTLDPLTAAQIPVYVRCTHRPDRPGTCILPARSAA
jgi:aspartate kinase